MKKTKIGFFDSGVGGLSVMHEAKKLLPEYDYIFYADTDNVPFGTKSREDVRSFTDKGVAFLLDMGADIVVIACNTATSVAVDYLRSKYTAPIIGMEPAVKLAHDRFSDKKVLVCATPITIAGDKLHSLIDSLYNGNEQPDLVALPELVKFAENCIFDSDTVSSYLAGSISKPEIYDVVVLGCTHFGYFRENMKEFFKNAELIDGNAGTVRRLIEIIEMNGLCKNNMTVGKTVYVNSGRVIEDEKTIKKYHLLTERL